jgi:hypothetical protein
VYVVCGLRRTAGQLVLDDVWTRSSYTRLLFCKLCLDLRVHKVYLIDFYNRFDDEYVKELK